MTRSLLRRRFSDGGGATRSLPAVGRPALLLLVLAAGAPVWPASPSSAAVDVSAARTLFETNLDAIQRRDRQAYLRCYLESEGLVRTGPEGFRLGFESLARETGSGWPDRFEATDLRLVPIRPGLVYGTYRYRVQYGAREERGLSERFFLKTAEGWRIAVTTAFPAPPETPPPPRALVGATLIDGTGGPPVRDAVVLLRDGKIDCAGSRSRCPVPAGVETMDLTGNWLTPGLVDAHVHFSQTGWADGRPDALDLREEFPYDQAQADLEAHPERFFRADLCSGVTAVFDVGGYPWTWRMREKFTSDTRAPHLSAAGPLLSTRDHWLNLPGERQFIHLGTEADARVGVRYLVSRGTDAVKVWFIPGRERDFEEMSRAVLAAGEQARRLGVPLIVHATGLREAKVALRAGAHLLVHSVGDRPVDDEFLQLARDNHTVYCPTLTVWEGYRRLFDSALSGRPPAVDDPNGCVDPETLKKVAATPSAGHGKVDGKEYRERTARFETRARFNAENLKRVHEAGIPVAMGTDAGNPLTLHGPSVYAEMEAMQAAGLAPMSVIVASTRGGALAMGRLDEVGTIEKGKAADLLVLRSDPVPDVAGFRRIRFVIRGGVTRSIDELQAARRNGLASP